MNISVNYKVRNNRLPEIIGKMPALVTAIVKKTAYDILDDAQNVVPVDTGYLGGSITVTTEEFYAEVEAAAEYAGYVEFGTWKMGAHPYMRPAAVLNAPKFDAAVTAILSSL